MFLLVITFLLSLLGCLCGFGMGVILAIIRKTTTKLLLPLRILIIIYTEIFRRVPFLVSLLLIFYIFQIVKISDSLFFIAIVTVCLIATAYGSAFRIRPQDYIVHIKYADILLKIVINSVLKQEIFKICFYNFELPPILK